MGALAHDADERGLTRSAVAVNDSIFDGGDMQSLHPDHLSDLRKSGLSDATIEEARINSVPPGLIGQRIGFDPPQVESAMAFPYSGTDFVRYKIFPPYRDKEGRTVKYLQRRGTPPRLYIPSKAANALADAQTPLFIVEGEKKTLAGIQAGLMCIGIGGIWNWAVDGRPVPDFDRIAWAGRPVTIVPDSDVWIRPDLLNAVYALGAEIEERGADVNVVQLPCLTEEI
jgi:hypothetical protein